MIKSFFHIHPILQRCISHILQDNFFDFSAQLLVKKEFSSIPQSLFVTTSEYFGALLVVSSSCFYAESFYTAFLKISFLYHDFGGGAFLKLLLRKIGGCPPKPIFRYSQPLYTTMSRLNKLTCQILAEHNCNGCVHV